jgi:hypothetical protein
VESGVFRSDRLSHAYIAGSNDLADTIAMATVCSVRDGERPCMSCINCDKASRHIHPDIMQVKKPEGKLIISVDQIRELRQDVYIVPNDSMQKAYIVRDADLMNINAQNAFLQILEEPPAHAVFILVTENPAALLPTVRSRCVELKPAPVDRLTDDSGRELEELASSFAAALADDNVLLMECMFRIDKLDRHGFNDFLVLLREKLVKSLREGFGHDALSLRKAFAHAESILNKAEEMLDLNVSTGHIAGFLCAIMVCAEVSD